MDDQGRIMAGAIEEVDTGCLCRLHLSNPANLLKRCISYTGGNVFQMK